MSGTEVLHALRADGDMASTRIIAVTGAVAAESEAGGAGFAVISRREFPEGYLLGLLGAALTRRGPEEQSSGSASGLAEAGRG